MVAAIAVYMVATHVLFGSVCPLYFVAGLPCPGCGLTRAGLLLLRGNPAESFRMHPLLLPVVAYLAIAAVAYIRNPQKMPRLYLPGILLLAVMVGVYIFRLTTRFPHTAPMTINENALLQNILSLIRER